MILYGLKTCDTCRKALKSLPDAVFVDVRKIGVPPEVLAKAYDLFGDKFLNTRSTTWRQMAPQDRGLPPLVLLRDAPTLMKRPLIVKGEQMWLGWTDKVRTQLGVG